MDWIEEASFHGFVKGALIALAMFLGMTIFLQIAIFRELKIANRHLASIDGSSDSCVAIILPPAPPASPQHISRRSRQ
jgi:hypothetical protein